SARYGSVPRALFPFRLGQAHLRVSEPEPIVRIGLAFAQFVPGELPGYDRIASDDALDPLIVRDSLHLEGMQLAEIGNLVERQRRVFDKPDSGRLGHKGLGRHDKFSLRFARPGGRSLLPSEMTGISRYIGVRRRVVQPLTPLPERQEHIGQYE